MRSLHGPVIEMPVAVLNDEAPRVRSMEILELAGALGSGRGIIPDDREARIRMVGLINEMAGEQGFAWHCRVILLDTWASQIDQAGQDANPMFKGIRLRCKGSRAFRYRPPIFFGGSCCGPSSI